MIKDISVDLIDNFFSADNANWCDVAKVERYALSATQGSKFPPIELVDEENGRYTVYDGHHRVAAFRLAGLTMINAKVD